MHAFEYIIHLFEYIINACIPIHNINSTPIFNRTKISNPSLIHKTYNQANFVCLWSLCVTGKGEFFLYSTQRFSLFYSINMMSGVTDYLFPIIREKNHKYHTPNNTSIFWQHFRNFLLIFCQNASLTCSYIY